MLYYLCSLYLTMNENNLKTKKLINFGPSGRAIAQPMDNSLLDNFLSLIHISEPTRR